MGPILYLFLLQVAFYIQYIVALNVQLTILLYKCNLRSWYTILFMTQNCSNQSSQHLEQVITHLPLFSY